MAEPTTGWLLLRAEGNAAQSALASFVVHAQEAAVVAADQRVSGIEAEGDRLGALVVRRQPGALLAQRRAQGVDEGIAVILANGAAHRATGC